MAHNIQYQPFGGFKRYTDGAGQAHNRHRDLDGRVSGYTLGKQSWLFNYDDFWRITGQAESNNASHSATYGYDTLGRLTQDSNSLGQFDYQYLGESGQPTAQEDKSSKRLGLWQFAYETNAADRRLKGIAWKAPCVRLVVASL